MRIEFDVEFCDLDHGECVVVDETPHPSRSRAFLCLVLLLPLAGLNGCSRKQAQVEMVDLAVKQYARVKAGMSKEDVVALLARTGKSGGWLIPLGCK